MPPTPRGDLPFPHSAFVQVAASADGIGKLLAVDGDTARIEYFASPAGPELHEVCAPVGRVHLVELSPQTRVFHFDGRGWRAGRVELPRGDGYHVSFPNRRLEEVPRASLYTRWAHPIDDPTGYLAARVTDTPFFFDGRAAAVRHLAWQRAVFGGLTGLVSSGIELLEHQVAIARRILNDPVQRYLLADEVGLGKTVEAGILIRQHLVDYPRDARILVVAPRHLVPQWRRELTTKFFLTSAQFTLVSEEDICRTPPDREGFTLLVVDEAHRAARDAFAASSHERRLFDTLRDLAQRTPRLLLLSGTPVLNQEDDFLAMLHLLDPDGYPLTGREAFRRRIRDRHTVAEAIADLGDESPDLFVTDALGRLQHLFADDSRLLQLCHDVRGRAAEATSTPARRVALRTLRAHVTDTYRLHRRLLRTRREDRRLQGHLPDRTGVAHLAYEDAARAEAFDFIETWRRRHLSGVHTETSDPIAETLCAVWVRAALSDPRVLVRTIDGRLALHAGHMLPATSARRDALAMPWAFEGEAAFLRERRTLLAEHLTADPRSRQLGDWLATTHDVRKVIVFVDDSAVADRVSTYLADVLGQHTVVRHTANGDEGRSFVHDRRLRVLVCDAQAEEGLNLQQAAATLVHYDLPLAPARIEQRIGRIDRIAARGRMRNLVLLSETGYEREWFAYLEAIRIFHRSVAPLQHVLAASATRILTSLLGEGPAAIATEADRMADPRTGCDAELLRIRQQESLDALESDPLAEQTFFDTLASADSQADDQGHAFDAWVIDRLHFHRVSYGSSVFRYVHDMDRPTLVPLLEVASRFGSCIDATTRRPSPRSRTVPMRLATFERHVAETEQVELIRVGHPFVDSMETLVRADDRGTAYAMWRHAYGWCDSPQVFFRFDFVVEADLSEAHALVQPFQAAPEALRRRAHDAFPVTYQTVWLDSDLRQIRDASLIGVLELPYSRTPRPDGTRDVHLRLERWAVVDAVVPVGDWADVCQRARTIAERLIRNDPALKARCVRHAAQAVDLGRHVNASLNSRLARLSGAARVSEQKIAALELGLSQALASGIAAPSLRADSAGAIFLASHPLRET